MLTFAYTLPRAVADLTLLNEAMDLGAQCYSDWRDHDAQPGTGDEIVVSTKADAVGCSADHKRAWLVDPKLHWSDWRRWMMPDLDYGLRQLQPGERDQIDCRFPETFPEPSIAGQRITIRTTLHSVRRRRFHRTMDELVAAMPRIGKNIDYIRRRATEALEKEATMTALWLLKQEILADIDNQARNVARRHRRSAGLELVAREFGIVRDEAAYEKALPPDNRREELNYRRAAHVIALEAAVLRFILDRAQSPTTIRETIVSQAEQREMVERAVAQFRLPKRPNLLDTNIFSEVA